MGYKTDVAEEWLKKHDKEYFSFKKKKKDVMEYPYLTSSQIERRARKEVAPYIDGIYVQTA